MITKGDLQLFPSGISPSDLPVRGERRGATVRLELTLTAAYAGGGWACSMHSVNNVHL